MPSRDRGGLLSGQGGQRRHMRPGGHDRTIPRAWRNRFVGGAVDGRGEQAGRGRRPQRLLMLPRKR